jgi:DNA-binding transcriptional LysR family regulator
MRITLGHLRAFVSVAELLSFKLAAEGLSKTQPAITFAIKKLEDSINLRLFQRTTRQIRLTAEGERFLPIAKRLIRDFDTALEDLNAVAEGRTGHVSIATVPSFSTELMPAILRRFRDHNPGVAIRLSDGNSTDIQRQLMRNEIDLAVVSSRRHSDQLMFTPLLEDQIMLLCHRDHPLAQSAGPVEWRELEPYPKLDAGLHGSGSARDQLGPSTIECSTTTTLFAMVRANLGLAVLPALATRSLSPELVSRPIVQPRLHRTVYLARRRDWTLSPAAESFIDDVLITLKGSAKDVDSPFIGIKIEAK